MKCNWCSNEIDPTHTHLVFELQGNTLVPPDRWRVTLCPDCSDYLIKEICWAKTELIHQHRALAELDQILNKAEKN